MKNIFFHLFDEIGTNLVRRALRQNNAPKEVKAFEEELRQKQYIQKINYYNYLSIFYFFYLNRIKVFLTSTILVDYLIFLLPSYDFYQQLIKKIDFKIVFHFSGYLLVFLMLWELFSKFSKQKKTSLISSKGLLLIILVLLIFAVIFQILLSDENEMPPIKIFLQFVFILTASGPIVMSIIKANKNKNRPNLSNIIIIINYILPIAILRVTHLVATISIFLLADRYWEYAIFSLVLLFLMIQKRPLVDPLIAPISPNLRRKKT